MIDYYLFVLSDEANKLNDKLIYPSSFEAMKMIIKEAATEKKENWETFKSYLEETAPNLYNDVKKFSKLAEFIFNRLK